IVGEELFYRIASLSYFTIAIAIPGAAFLQDIQLHAHIYYFTYFADSFSENNIELYLAERRCYFILHHFHAGAVAACHIAVFDLADAADIQANGSIEFQRISSSSGFGVAEHHSYFFPKLV